MDGYFIAHRAPKDNAPSVDRTLLSQTILTLELITSTIVYIFLLILVSFFLARGGLLQGIKRHDKAENMFIYTKDKLNRIQSKNVNL